MNYLVRYHDWPRKKEHKIVMNIAQIKTKTEVENVNHPASDLKIFLLEENQISCL